MSTDPKKQTAIDTLGVVVGVFVGLCQFWSLWLLLCLLWTGWSWLGALVGLAVFPMLALVGPMLASMAGHHQPLLWGYVLPVLAGGLYAGVVWAIGPKK